MSYEQINSVPKVEQDRAMAAPVQMQMSTQVKAAEPKKAVGSSDEAKVETARPNSIMSGNVRLKFVVDEKSNDITVLVVNRETQEVVRTIPPEELRDYQDGDLLSLFA